METKNEWWESFIVDITGSNGCRWVGVQSSNVKYLIAEAERRYAERVREKVSETILAQCKTPHTRMEAERFLRHNTKMLEIASKVDGVLKEKL